MNVFRKLFILLALLFPLLAHAVGEPYMQEKFDALNKSGKPALVFIYADWCPTCKAQDKILNTLLPSDEFKAISMLRVNFDEQKPVVNAFGVKHQSTLIIFKGGKEVVRMTGDTDQDRIAALLRNAL